MIYMNFIREIRRIMKGIATPQLADISTTSKKKKSKPYELEVNTKPSPWGSNISPPVARGEMLDPQGLGFRVATAEKIFNFGSF